MYTVILGYFSKIPNEKEQLESKLNQTIKQIFSEKFITLEEEIVSALADILNLISTSRLELAIKLLLDLLPDSTIDPKKQIIGLSAYTAIGSFKKKQYFLNFNFFKNKIKANRLFIIQNEETQVNIKVTSKKKKTRKFDTSRKLLKSFRQNSLSIRSRSTLLVTIEESELLKVKK